MESSFFMNKPKMVHDRDNLFMSFIDIFNTIFPLYQNNQSEVQDNCPFVFLPISCNAIMTIDISLNLKLFVNDINLRHGSDLGFKIIHKSNLES